MSGSGYGQQADIWSLGCCLVEMASGETPWGTFDNNIAAMVRIAMSNETPAIPSHLSAIAKDFISGCLERDWKKRPSAKKLLEHDFVRVIDLEERVEFVSCCSGDGGVLLDGGMLALGKHLGSI